MSKSMLYVKPTNSHSYLDYDSCHPQHNNTAFPILNFWKLEGITQNWPYLWDIVWNYMHIIY